MRRTALLVLGLVGCATGNPPEGTTDAPPSDPVDADLTMQADASRIFDAVPSDALVAFDAVPSDALVAFDAASSDALVASDAAPPDALVAFDAAPPDALVAFDAAPPDAPVAFDAAPPDAPPANDFPPVYEGSGVFSEYSTAPVATFAYPAGVQVDDVLVLPIALYFTQGGTPSAPGWTLMYSNYDYSYLGVAVLWRRAGAGEASSVDVTIPAGPGRVFGAISRYSGCATSGDPYEVVNSVSGTLGMSQTTSHSSPSLGDHRLAVMFHLWVSGNPVDTTGTAGYTVDASLSGSLNRIVMFSQEIADSVTADGTAQSTMGGNAFTLGGGFYLKPEE